MDSKDVSRALREVIRPILKTRGFSGFTTRTSWRYVGARIDVVNFQSFNSHLAETIGCTTFSFSINLGCMFSDIPSSLGSERIKVRDGRSRPEEYECTFRGRLERGYRRKLFFDTRDIWFIDRDGRNLNHAIRDASAVIETDGLPWFEGIADHSSALDLLKHDDFESSRLHGPGAADSPLRNYYMGYFALAQGENALAVASLTDALNSGCFDALRSDLESAIERAV